MSESIVSPGIPLPAKSRTRKLIKGQTKRKFTFAGKEVESLTGNKENTRPKRNGRKTKTATSNTSNKESSAILGLPLVTSEVVMGRTRGNSRVLENEKKKAAAHSHIMSLHEEEVNEIPVDLGAAKQKPKAKKAHTKQTNTNLYDEFMEKSAELSMQELEASERKEQGGRRSRANSTTAKTRGRRISGVFEHVPEDEPEVTVELGSPVYRRTRGALAARNAITVLDPAFSDAEHFPVEIGSPHPVTRKRGRSAALAVPAALVDPSFNDVENKSEQEGAEEEEVAEESEAEEEESEAEEEEEEEGGDLEEDLRETERLMNENLKARGYVLRPRAPPRDTF